MCMFLLLSSFFPGLRVDPKDPLKRLLVLDMVGNLFRAWKMKKICKSRLPGLQLLVSGKDHGGGGSRDGLSALQATFEMDPRFETKPWIQAFLRMKVDAVHGDVASMQKQNVSEEYVEAYKARNDESCKGLEREDSWVRPQHVDLPDGYKGALRTLVLACCECLKLSKTVPRVEIDLSRSIIFDCQELGNIPLPLSLIRQLSKCIQTLKAQWDKLVSRLPRALNEVQFAVEEPFSGIQVVRKFYLFVFLFFFIIVCRIGCRTLFVCVLLQLHKIWPDVDQRWSGFAMQ